MSDNDRRYAFSISRGGQGPTEDYEKRESELNEQEISLLAGELLHRFNEAPDLVRSIIYQHIDKLKR